MKATLRSYVATLFSVVRLKLVWALALSVMFSLTEGIGIAMLLPTLQAAGMNLNHQGVAGRYARLIASGLRSVGLPPTLLILLGIFVILVSLRSLLGSMHGIAAYGVQLTMEDSLRTRLYRAIANANWLFVCRMRSTDFAHALTDEVGRVGVATAYAMTLLGNAVLAVLYIVIAFKLSTGMTAMVLVSGAMLAFVLRGRTRAVHDAGEEIVSGMRSLYAATIEQVQSLKTAKAYGAQERHIRLFAGLSSSVAEAGGVSNREIVKAGLWFELGSVMILAMVVYVAVRVLVVPAAAILILLLLFARLMPRFMAMHREYQAFVNALPAFRSVMELEARCAAAEEPADGRAEPIEFARELRFDNVSFAYRPDSKPAADGIDLVIPAGKVTALVGPSGAGKSTVADLAMGLLTAQRGVVSVDGTALDTAGARAWRERIGYVAQDTFMFHATVRENLRWAEPEASEEEMREALRLAAADEIVRALPQGIDTIVGERGTTLSQGERQRLSLARAFLRRPAMLILDEATNSLDSDNESRVLDAAVGLSSRTGVVLIAHRMSTIRWADLVYVIENGSVVESGTWQQLTAKTDGHLRALCEAQGLNM